MSDYVENAGFIGGVMEELEMTNSDSRHEQSEHFISCFPAIITEETENNGKVLMEKPSVPGSPFPDETIDETERYEFIWIGKRAAVRECFKPTRKILKPVLSDSISWKTTENLYIEGDNLDVLKLLQKSYANRIRMIYIDPPYNIGNDFLYKDDYALDGKADATRPEGFSDVPGDHFHARCHSGWCSMMYPRLVLARNLMTDDGVIFISIDEYELDNLKKICDEIFWESCFVTIIGLEITKTQGMKVKFAKEGSVVKNFEYILCYTKNAINKKIVRNLLYDRNEGYDTHFCHYIKKMAGTIMSAG